MKKIYRFCAVILALSAFVQVSAESIESNLVTPEYIKEHLNSGHPRLILTPEKQRILKEKIQTDPVISNMYCMIKQRAEEIQTEPLLEWKLRGRFLYHITQKMLYRINMLGIVYRMEKDPKVLARINDELIAVSHFPDWNPQHFLDVGEMALAVSLALDWTAGDLPQETIDLAQNALIEKAINSSFEDNEKNNWWISFPNNWCQVCHGGMVAAALAVAERDPELAAATIRRALDNIHQPLSIYAPDGVYPEGTSYWEFGTQYTIVMFTMLESALGNDFGIWKSPGFMDSAVYRLLTETPIGHYNFSDCGLPKSTVNVTLPWFAAKTGNAAFLQKDRFLCPPEENKKPHRLTGVSLVWMAQYEPKTTSDLPCVWRGRGEKPIIIFRGGKADPRQYYFAAIGGLAWRSHGNMDSGSFIFELDGIRWGIDAGAQAYYPLEKIGFGQWEMEQDGERWTLLTKNNFGHNTLTINKQLHLVKGRTELVDFKYGDNPSGVFDMTAVFGDLAENVQRKFTKDGPVSLLIEDKIVPSEKTEQVTWQFLTTADAEITPEGATLTQDGKELRLIKLSHPELSFVVVSLDPPPLEVDKKIKNLKRIELRIPVSDAKKDVNIHIRLSGRDND